MGKFQNCLDAYEKEFKKLGLKDTPKLNKGINDLLNKLDYQTGSNTEQCINTCLLRGLENLIYTGKTAVL
ncbi:MAG: hypothetical protein EBS24_08035 [Chitinophagia bacterium]|nr:hypothetical protein [Chitinophagia bacterium]